MNIEDMPGELMEVAEAARIIAHYELKLAMVSPGDPTDFI
jgi:hypothetical protein